MISESIIVSFYRWSNWQKKWAPFEGAHDSFGPGPLDSSGTGVLIAA